MLWASVSRNIAAAPASAASVITSPRTLLPRPRPRLRSYSSSRMQSRPPDPSDQLHVTTAYPTTAPSIASTSHTCPNGHPPAGLQAANDALGIEAILIDLVGLPDHHQQPVAVDGTRPPDHAHLLTVPAHPTASLQVSHTLDALGSTTPAHKDRLVCASPERLNRHADHRSGPAACKRYPAVGRRATPGPTTPTHSSTKAQGQRDKNQRRVLNATVSAAGHRRQPACGQGPTNPREVSDKSPTTPQQSTIPRRRPWLVRSRRSGHPTSAAKPRRGDPDKPLEGPLSVRGEHDLSEHGPRVPRIRGRRLVAERTN